jgi:hypothetical protein
MARPSLRATRAEKSHRSSFVPRLACEVLEERRMLSVQGQIVADSALLTSELQPIGDDQHVGDGNASATVATMPGRGSNVVAGNASGNYVSVWYGRLPDAPESEPPGLYAQRFNRTGEAVGAPIVIDDSSAFAGYKVAMAANGSFVVAWNRSEFFTAFHSPLIVQRYDSDGRPVGSPMPVAGLPSQIQSLSMNDDGSFVIGFTITETSFRGAGETLTIEIPWEVIVRGIPVPDPPQGFIQNSIPPARQSVQAFPSATAYCLT